MDDPSFESRHRKENFSSHQIFQKFPVTHSASYSMSTESLPRVKWPKPDVHHSPPHSAEVKNERSCRLCLLPMCFHGVDSGNLSVYFQPQLTSNVDFTVLCSSYGLPIPFCQSSKFFILRTDYLGYYAASSCNSFAIFW
jgi:hypothetical protein